MSKLLYFIYNKASYRYLFFLHNKVTSTTSFLCNFFLPKTIFVILQSQYNLLLHVVLTAVACSCCRCWFCYTHVVADELYANHPANYACLPLGIVKTKLSSETAQNNWVCPSCCLRLEYTIDYNNFN